VSRKDVVRSRPAPPGEVETDVGSVVAGRFTLRSAIVEHPQRPIAVLVRIEANDFRGVPIFLRIGELDHLRALLDRARTELVAKGSK
jgi:hypothetical protein